MSSSVRWRSGHLFGESVIGSLPQLVDSEQLTECMAVVLNCDAKNLKCMHPNAHTLDALFAFEDKVN